MSKSKWKSCFLPSCGARSIPSVCFMSLLLGTAVSVASAQQVSLSLASGSTTPGGSVTVNLALANSGGSQPAAVQWSMTYSAADISGVTVVDGSAATAASKTVVCNSTSGSAICIVSGLNDNAIASGALASITFNVASSPKDSSVPVQLAGLAASAADGSGVAAAGSGGTIAINKSAPLALSALSCTPGNVATPGSAACTISLNGSATGNGFPVTVQSNNSNVTVPSAVTVSSGQSSAGFSAKAASVSSTQNAVLTAAAAGVSKTFTLALSPTGPAPVLISSLTCNPSSIYSGGTSSCTAVLVNASSSSTAISLSSNNKLMDVPSSVSVPAGSLSAGFNARAATISSTQTAVITATGPNNSQTFTENLLAGSAPAGNLSIWSPKTVPGTITDSDANAVELGLQFTSDVAGTVTGVRFYKGPQNTGTHLGHLWTSGGTLLASVTFTNETPTGWQQANFAKPVAIQAHTTYVVSYYCPASHYSSDNWFFQNSAVNNPPLHALQNSSSTPNGLYVYGQSGFPNQTWDASNYWVDVVFTPAQ